MRFTRWLVGRLGGPSALHSRQLMVSGLGLHASLWSSRCDVDVTQVEFTGTPWRPLLHT
jgi:hypothetical protein